MNLGIDPVLSAMAAKFAIQVGAWVVSGKINAAAAAQQAAAEFDYFRQLADAELVPIALEMARKFPEYNYWRWLQIVENIKKYGASASPQPEPPPVQKAGNALSWFWIAAGIAVILLVWQR